MASSTPQRRKTQAERLTAWATEEAAQIKRSTPDDAGNVTDPAGFRRCLQAGGLAAVVYPNGSRVVVRVTRLTMNYVFVSAARDVDSGRKNPAEWGYSVKTGLQFSSTDPKLKPRIVPATRAEKKGVVDARRGK